MYNNKGFSLGMSLEITYQVYLGENNEKETFTGVFKNRNRDTGELEIVGYNHKNPSEIVFVNIPEHMVTEFQMVELPKYLRVLALDYFHQVNKIDIANAVYKNPTLKRQEYAENIKNIEKLYTEYYITTKTVV